MLRFFTGVAGTGKTGAVMNEICDAVRGGRAGSLMIVPEQYSHEAERELCRVCGGTMSLYAEALSFTGLARKILSAAGDSAPLLDKGGRLLCMALTLSGISSRLKVYGAARNKPELQALLLGAVDEFKTACVSPEALMTAADTCPDELCDKLRDLALVLQGYDAVVANGRADPSDTLTKLAAAVPDSFIGPGTRIYIDGFTDFTAQERRVIAALMETGADITLCLTTDPADSENEAFAVPRTAQRQFERMAGEMGVETESVVFDTPDGKAAALRFFDSHMFSYTAEKCESTGEVTLYRADDLTAECELAAAECIRLVRDKDCRWRDIAVAVRGFEDYRPALESVFEHYGVPLFITRKSDLLSKPLPAMINGAYEVVQGGYEPEDVFSYLRTGLAGITPAETDKLENYVLLWQLRGTTWTRPGDWRQHPQGSGREYNDDTEKQLSEINRLRRLAATPLADFARRGQAAKTALEQAQALADFFEDTDLAEKLSDRAQALEGRGQAALAMEYQQLWELCVSALEQTAAVLGDAEMDMRSFGRLFTLVLSQYDVGTIPVSLDRVAAGDFDRMRRRSIKHLIVLGASDDRLPGGGDDSGVFSGDERRRLLEMDIDLGGAGENELWREFSLIYNTLTLPKESLIMSTSGFSGGEELRPSFVMNRAAALFDIPIRRREPADVKMSAPAPAMELAAMGLRSGDAEERAAVEYFSQREPERLAILKSASELGRGKLSPEAVRALYGDSLRLSASRIDKFSSCRFAYFVQYGLRAKPRKPAGLTPPEIGTFMHYVLQHTAGDVMAQGGFNKVTDEELAKITDRHIAEYVRTELNDFQEKTSRFRYLFKRLCGDVRRVVADMAGELRVSEFKPLDFELDFGRDKRLPPVQIGGGEDALILAGVADRVDGWLHDGKLYLRVVDYKTGRKKFELSDVWYGMGLQMLLYLFTLEKNGGKLYGHDIVPAGVLYVPARDVLLSSPTDLDAEDALIKRAAQLRRSGLVLDDGAVIDAMEHGDAPRYIPVKFKDGVPGGDALASAERFGKLSRHIDETLRDMAKELRHGSIAADPYYRSQQENACLNCDYFDACHFSDGEGGDEMRYYTKLKPDSVWKLMEGGDDNG